MGLGYSACLQVFGKDANLYASSCQVGNGVMFRLIYDMLFPNWSGNLVRFGYFCSLLGTIRGKSNLEAYFFP